MMQKKSKIPKFSLCIYAFIYFQFWFLEKVEADYESETLIGLRQYVVPND